tara:strand:+ start:221 stop:889 length:669 start_codon:yes stop_codon:yes gene_type:complete
MKSYPLTIIPLAIACSLLLGYQYLGATWSEPTGSPPANNVDAPINVGSTDQVKNGGLSVDALAVFGDVAITSGGTLIVSNICNADQSTCGTVEEFLATSTSGGGSTPGNLFANQHTETQCTSLGGEVVAVGGETICRFPQNSCPSGWTNFSDWSTTENRSCTGTGYWGCSVGTVNTGSHPWSNIAPESVTYRTNGIKVDGENQCQSYTTLTCSATVTQIGCY